VEKVRKGTTSERDRVITACPGRPRSSAGLLRRRTRTTRQAGQGGFAGQGQMPAGFVVQHVLRKARGQAASSSMICA
jgi:hypothetical protein